MLEYLFNLLPAFAQRLIRPEVDDLIANFTKLDAQFNRVIHRHVSSHAILHEIRAEIDSEIADTAAEIERAKRIAARIADLVS